MAFSGLLFAILVAFCAKWIDLWAWAREPKPLLHTLPYYLAITPSSCEVSPFHLYALLFVNLVVTCVYSLLKLMPEDLMTEDQQLLKD